MTKNIKWIGLAIVLGVGLIYNILYFGMPVFHPDFSGIYFVWFILMIHTIVLMMRLVPKEEEYGYDDYRESFRVLKSMLKFKPLLVSFILTILSVLSFTIFPFLSSTPMLGNADNYRELIGEVKTEEFSKSNLKVSLEHIRIIYERNAKRLGEKKLGEDLGLGSRVTIGIYNIQKVKDELFWVAPLQYKGFFKWLSGFEKKIILKIIIKEFLVVWIIKNE